MARNIVTLEPETLYRAVMLELYPGVHDLPMKVYTDADGIERKYHRVSVNGPYGSKGTATAQVNRLIKEHNWKLGQNYRNGGNYYYENTVPGTIPEVAAFVESVTPSWTLVAGTTKTP